MEKIMFYFFITILIPTLIALFSYGNYVYTITEFKIHTKKIPNIFKILGAKLVFLGIIETHMFHYLFHDYIPENFYFISVFVNFYIMFELIFTNKFISGYRKYLEFEDILQKDKFEFESFLLGSTKKILKSNLFFYTFNEIFAMITAVLLLLNATNLFSPFNYMLLACYICLYGTKFYSSKYLSTL